MGVAERIEYAETIGRDDIVKTLQRPETPRREVFDRGIAEAHPRFICT